MSESWGNTKTESGRVYGMVWVECEFEVRNKNGGTRLRRSLEKAVVKGVKPQEWGQMGYASGKMARKGERSVM